MVTPCQFQPLWLHNTDSSFLLTAKQERQQFLSGRYRQFIAITQDSVTAYMARVDGSLGVCL